MTAKGSSARRTIHALVTPSGIVSAKPLRRVRPYFRICSHLHDSLTEAAADPRLTSAQQKP